MYSTIEMEDRHHLSFCRKEPISIVKGQGVIVWDELGRSYLDFTSGWAVTSLGHCHPVIVDAIRRQSEQIMHNPNSGLTYSPARARLLARMLRVLPPYLNRMFFTNSGAEANDAALKLARKVAGKPGVICANRSFHGRTIGTVSATGQSAHRDRFSVLVPHFTFVPFGDAGSVDAAIGNDTAAVMVEPVQGEGGVIVPPPDYLERLSAICKARDVLLILDEIQTGFFRTGPCFAGPAVGARPDILTMAKGIAGGFPFGAVAVTGSVAEMIEEGDHGGTYNGNPLGCAVASAVIDYMLDVDVGAHVNRMGAIVRETLERQAIEYPGVVADVRGAGLLQAVEFTSEQHATMVYRRCIREGLLLNLKHGTIIRLFPALTIEERELRHGLDLLHDAICWCAAARGTSGSLPADGGGERGHCHTVASGH